MNMKMKFERKLNFKDIQDTQDILDLWKSINHIISNHVYIYKSKAKIFYWKTQQ